MEMMENLEEEARQVLLDRKSNFYMKNLVFTWFIYGFVKLI